MKTNKIIANIQVAIAAMESASVQMVKNGQNDSLYSAKTVLMETVEDLKGKTKKTECWVCGKDIDAHLTFCSQQCRNEYHKGWKCDD